MPFTISFRDARQIQALCIKVAGLGDRICVGNFKTRTSKNSDIYYKVEYK